MEEKEMASVLGNSDRRGYMGAEGETEYYSRFFLVLIVFKN